METETMTASRRNFLGLAAAAPLAILAAKAANAAAPAACYDPAALPLSQRNRRRSLGYIEMSSDAKKRCGACAFFTAAANASCGSCQLLGSTVNAGAVCTSFAAKAKP
jgi:hypothetical protein